MNSRNLKERVQREVERFEEIEQKLSSPEVSSDPSSFKELSRQHSRLSSRIEPLRKYLSLLLQLDQSNELLADSSADSELKEMAEAEKQDLESSLEQMRDEVETMLIPPDPNDGKSVIVEIRAGTGGDEAGLFVGDLLKMYTRFCEENGLKVEPIYYAETELGGFKEVTFSVEGKRAWELLHKEAGAHRVQRIPVTESGGRIHTSAVTVSVLAEAEEEDLEIEDKDLRVDVFRASGAGGQHVNKTESAVRMTHIPTGIVVSCQDERSQLKNRAKAMKVMRARLLELREEERHAQEAAAKKEQVKSGDRSERIRTYNFPQGRVTDHRIGYTAYNLNELMEGDMQDLLDAVIQAEKEEKLKQLQET
ncbi:MAG TPA: peptide chain release factor 1 [Leptospiraceae bacterium]|nr:peptide chain release factor 1 [Spirochaetaceae bacterium]HBS05432.1 peptide chain release factor 1 [Leptospiraceae bacterium]|tara:strand:- start:59774 stop:60865 length:1092 start_codon:yes stop_codon:yes gene_type:complete